MFLRRILVGLLLFVCACQGRSNSLPTLSEAPEFSVQDLSGAKLKKSDLINHVTAINFFFTSCPEVCPTVNGKISILAHDFKSDSKVQFISVSIDPETDTAVELKKYAERFKADGTNWRLTRAPIEEVQQMAHGLELEAGESKELHTTRVAVIDKAGKLRALMDAMDQDATQKIKDVILALE